MIGERTKNRTTRVGTVWRRRVSAMGSLVAAVVLVAACGGQGGSKAAGSESVAKSITIRLSTESPTGLLFTKEIQAWGDLLNKRSKGRITVKVYPDGQLYKDSQTLQLMSSGGPVEMGLTALATTTTLVPAVSVYDLPYLDPTGTPDGWMKLVDPDSKLGGKIHDQFQGKGVELLGSWYVGKFPVVSGKPIASLDDIKGQKVRAPGGSAIIEATMKALGATPVAVSPQEAPSALQQGLVSSAFGTYPYWLGSLKDIAKYGTDTQGLFNSGQFILASESWWKSLSSSDQKLINDALSDIIKDETTKVESAEKDAQDSLKASGHQLVPLSSSETRRWKDATKSVWDHAGSIVGEDVLKIARDSSGR
ncbi:MAG: yiaO [Subtercola sp.]|nr:yiaO [Subtercola sp.]